MSQKYETKIYHIEEALKDLDEQNRVLKEQLSERRGLRDDIVADTMSKIRGRTGGASGERGLHNAGSGGSGSRGGARERSQSPPLQVRVQGQIAGPDGMPAGTGAISFPTPQNSHGTTRAQDAADRSKYMSAAGTTGGSPRHNMAVANHVARARERLDAAKLELQGKNVVQSPLQAVQATIAAQQQQGARERSGSPGKNRPGKIKMSDKATESQHSAAEKLRKLQQRRQDQRVKSVRNWNEAGDRGGDGKG